MTVTLKCEALRAEPRRATARIWPRAGDRILRGSRGLSSGRPSAGPRWLAPQDDGVRVADDARPSPCAMPARASHVPGMPQELAQQPAIAVDRLVKVYKTTRAVDGISFALEPGSITGLLG